MAVHPRVPPMSELEAITPKTLGPVDGEGFECNRDISPAIAFEAISHCVQMCENAHWSLVLMLILVDMCVGD